MKKRQNILNLSILFSAIIIFFSCGDNSLFDQAEEGEYGIELSLSDGSIIENGQKITFNIVLPENEEEPESLDITVYSSNGTKVAENSIKNPEPDKDLVLELPELEQGLYKITFTLYGTDYVLKEQTVNFFYSESTFLIKGIESFPPVISPGTAAILKAELTIPENTDPYLRWTQNDTLITSGMFSDGFAEINWTAPDTEGVYSIALDVFPIAPANGSFSFRSQCHMDTEVYVTSSSDFSSENDLGPDDSYYVLFHFNGNLNNSGTGFDSLTATTNKELKITQINETIGYKMDNSSEIIIPEFILPVSDGKLQPFTIELGVFFNSITEDSTIISINTPENDFYFNIFINKDLVPEAEIYMNSKTFYIPSGIENIQINRQYMLNLSVIPESTGFNIIWFLNGDTYSSSLINISPALNSDSGNTVISFNGIIDEFGVYFKDNLPSADPYIYYNAMRLLYKSKLLFAYGFDSNSLSSDMNLTNNATIGSGVLELKSGQKLTLPQIIIPSPDNLNRINILLNSPSGFTYSFNNSILEIEVTDNNLFEKISLMNFTIDSDSINLSGNVFKLTGNENIIIKIVNNTESSIFIDSLLAYTE